MQHKHARVLEISGIDAELMRSAIVSREYRSCDRANKLLHDMNGLWSTGSGDRGKTTLCLHRHRISRIYFDGRGWLPLLEPFACWAGPTILLTFLAPFNGPYGGFTPVRLAGYLSDRHSNSDVSIDVTAQTTDKSEEIDWTDPARVQRIYVFSGLWIRQSGTVFHESNNNP
ncbi:hypothetical protein Pmani_018682 [Petrolisthes manimaculis]|uniref:Uncharacterized protein n=1 Tax=Petrolisthes manimaculis TaxID=1843537 RepID=A0AAE1PJQ4_9EUCA|nr:hypothetical protein Pmani_018682 [Petrolisthes manimaculis]